MRATVVSAFLTVTLILCGCAVQPAAFDAMTRVPVHQRAQADRQLVVTIRESESILSARAGTTPKAYGNNGPYRPSPYARKITDELAREYGLTWIAEWRIEVLGVHCVVFSAKDREAQARVLSLLRKDKRVESAQPMNIFHTASDAVSGYNDPYFRLQHQVEAVRIPQAHRWSRGRGVRVAVIDTGADLNHPELVGRIRLARNFVDDDDKAFRSDMHGTAVAGLIAAAANNGLGIVGVAPEVELLVLKACWHTAPGEGAVCNTLTLAEALAYAIEHNAAVINLSLGGPEDPLLRRLVEIALRRGTIVIGAEATQKAFNQAFPVAIPGVLAVADGDAWQAEHQRARIAAPGREVLTLMPFGKYDYVSGASISSAMVSGIVALLLEKNPGLPPDEVENLLERTASTSLLTASASKLVNACNAVASIVQAERCEEPVMHSAQSLRFIPRAVRGLPEDHDTGDR